MPGKRTLYPLPLSRIIGLLALLAVLLVGIGLGIHTALAESSSLPSTQTSPLHPDFPLLDEDQRNVLESGNPVSTRHTCGACHDTAFIVQHSYHASAGLGDLSRPGEAPSGRPWDISPGFFGSWNAIEYRYLSPAGDDRLDLTTPDWLKMYGIRHVGGGPAVYSREGVRLTDLAHQPGDPETNQLNPATGELTPWDWEESGVVEMNCFLCHTSNPDNESRMAEIQSGNFQWANTATLANRLLVKKTGTGYQWQSEAFNSSGEITQEIIGIQDPDNENCGLCHGLVHDNVEDPLVTYGCSPERWSTITTGQIISPQKLADTGMNLKDKTELDRSWDVHAERLLDCTDCHYSLNNPLYYQESASTRPEHLTFDPRRLEIGDYLLKPLHQFARGNSAQSSVAPALKNTMRDCQSCHNVDNTHSWLPYKEAHLEAVSCESCHIPRIYSSANMQHDWTVIKPDGSARRECRGVDGEIGIGSLLTGYRPVLLPALDADGKSRLAPHNLITTWYWVHGDPPRPVPQRDLEAAYLENGQYHPGVMLRFDQDQDGELSKEELILNSPEKEDFIKKRLLQLGLEFPRIKGEIQPYSINHTVATEDWALRDCRACHGRASRVTAPIQLSSYSPGRRDLPRSSGSTLLSAQDWT